MGTKFWGKGFLGKVLWGQNVGDKDFEITFVAQKRVEERFSSGEDWMQSKKKTEVFCRKRESIKSKPQ